MEDTQDWISIKGPLAPKFVEEFLARFGCHRFFRTRRWEKEPDLEPFTLGKEIVEKAEWKWFQSCMKVFLALMMSFLGISGLVSCVSESYPGSTSSGFRNAEAIEAVEER